MPAIQANLPLPRQPVIIAGRATKAQISLIIMIDLIKSATLSNEASQQKTAEASLVKLLEEQPHEFFIGNARILNSKDIAVPIRQAAGTLLVVSLKRKTNDNYLWYALSPPSRSAFKEMILNTMIDSQKVIRRAAANTVAALCCIEIPKNEWPGIVEKLTENIGSTDNTVKEVSILTIGFICEQLKDFTFEEKQQETILTGILMGVKDTHPEIVETAFKALRDGLPAMGGIMKNPQVKDYLISQMIEAIANKNFVDYSLQSIMEFVRYYYCYLELQHVNILANHTIPVIQDTRDENCCTLAMELWGDLVREEKNIESNPNMNRFVTGALGEQLVQCLLQNLCFVEENDEEANGISEGAAGALEAIFDGASQEYEKKILGFTQNTIRHENWRYRQASIRAFSLLLIGLSQERSQALVNSSLLELVSLLNDSVQYVQLSAVRSLSMICEQVPEVMLHHSNFLQILDFVVKMGRTELFLKHVCRIIDNLAVSDSSSTIMGPHAGELIKVFLQISLESNRSLPLINSCFNAIINLIKCSASLPLCNHYIDYVLKGFSSIHPLQKQRRQLFYSGFLTIVQVCLLTIRKSNGSITMDQMSTLYDLVVEHYKRINDVDGDGFYVVSALAFFIPNDRRLIDDFWKYIEHGLRKTNQDAVFRSAISCICDFATIYRDLIADKVEPTLLQIMDLYGENYITRELKLDVLMCLGELFLQCGDLCYKHLARVMGLMVVSCQGVLSISDLNYAEILQDAIIETLMCLVHGINDESFMQVLPEYMPFITEFVNRTTEKGRRPKLEYVQQGLMLLADIAHLFPSEREKLVQTQFLRDRVGIMVRFNNDGHLSQSIAFVKEQFRINL